MTNDSPPPADFEEEVASERPSGIEPYEASPSASPAPRGICDVGASGGPAVWRRRALAGAGVALVALALVAVLCWPRVGMKGTALVTAAEGGPSVGSLLPEGARLAAGSDRLCVRLESKVDLCLAQESEARLERVTGTELRIALERGRLVASLPPLPADENLVVVCPIGEVSASGAVFSVTAAPGDVRVAVVEGRVHLTGERSLIEGEGVQLPGGKVDAIELAERRIVSDLLAGVAPPLNQPAVPLGRELGALGPEPPSPLRAEPSADASAMAPTPSASTPSARTPEPTCAQRRRDDPRPSPSPAGS
ncbi:MAG: FecR domain-containing protein [Polyangiaceae bacterium]|nr:FecR domain-containing protein [Polyangiaceae bacterium]